MSGNIDLELNGIKAEVFYTDTFHGRDFYMEIRLPWRNGTLGIEIGEEDYYELAKQLKKK